MTHLSAHWTFYKGSIGVVDVQSSTERQSASVVRGQAIKKNSMAVLRDMMGNNIPSTAGLA